MKKEYFVNMLITFILSLIFISITSIDYKLYNVVIVSIFFIIRAKFHKGGEEIYVLSSLMTISFFIAMGTHTIITNIKVDWDTCDKILTLFTATCTTALLISGLSKNTEVEIHEIKFIGSQQEDLERIKQYLKSVDIVGVNGAWGTGKTFLMEALQEECKDEYIFIIIDLLSCNVDDIQLIIFNALEKVLSNNHIYSRQSKEIKSILSSVELFRNVFSLIQPDELSYSVALKNLKKELNLLDKAIVIIYEDIDRITGKDTIKKIFGISEQISCDFIKIIYQFDVNKMEMLEFNREYLEKYIPYIINMTPMNFQDVVKYLLMTKFKSQNIISCGELEYLTASYDIGGYMQLLLDDRRYYD